MRNWDQEKGPRFDRLAEGKSRFDKLAAGKRAQCPTKIIAL